MIHRHGAERLSHVVFVVTLLGKGLLGVIQIISAIAVALGVMDQLPNLARWFFQDDLIENPKDPFAARFIALADQLHASDSTFYAIYFTAHGLLHIGVVVALLMGLIWAYPVAIAVLAGFVVYQTVEWFAVGGAILWVLSAIDIVVIWLTLHEWRIKRAALAPLAATS